MIQTTALFFSVIPARSPGQAGGGTQGWRRVTPEKHPCVYILASRRDGTLYVGVTSDLARRIWEHKSDVVGGFTRRYGVHTLVYVEFNDTMERAILREKQIKRWKRAWKLKLIERDNPQWRDLYDDLPL